MVLERLEQRYRHRAAGRRRQLDLFEATHLRGHARKAAEHSRAMRKLRELMGQVAAESAPRWRLEFAARFVARWEGLRTVAYQDSGGVWTIGYGHTGRYAYPGNTISKAFALVLLAGDLAGASHAVARNVDVPLTIRERIAAISFTFNVGEGGLRGSTFLRRLNEGRRREAADALLMWVRDADGDVLLGLQRRRRAERWLMLHPKKGVTR